VKSFSGGKASRSILKIRLVSARKMACYCKPDPRKDGTMPRQRRTGRKAAKAASRVLRSKKTGKDSKTAAASELSQAAPKRKRKKR